MSAAHQQSTFCPYTETSNAYDQTRKNPGLNVIIGSCSLAPWPLSGQRLLDVGGGTGSFVEQVRPMFLYVSDES
eukprot:gene1585-16481_t